jgi:hypothetical protein
MDAITAGLTDEGSDMKTKDETVHELKKRMFQAGASTIHVVIEILQNFDIHTKARMCKS